MFLVKLLQSKITLTLKKAKSIMCPDLCCQMRSRWLLWEDKCTQHQLCSLLPGCQVSAVKYSKGLNVIEWGQAFTIPYSNNWGSLTFLLSDYLLCGSVAWCSSPQVLLTLWWELYCTPDLDCGFGCPVAIQAQASRFLSQWLVTRNYRTCLLDWRWCDQMFFKTGHLLPRPSILGAQ